ncbi:hypothetical protein [Microbacterium sp. YY-01]|uniref:hypothetical protein n=1 Tax=Microbacterium sp. YY-01 TaxID=3421634 RepID=UPI003D16AF60
MDQLGRRAKVDTSTAHEARIEFYQHLRDEELGRWREKPDDDFVAIPLSEHEVIVLNERTGGSITWVRGAAEQSTSFGAATARAYFEAHPARKPWHDAVDGELWLIRFSDYPNTDVSALAKNGTFVYNDHCCDGWADFDDDTIIAGRRIWPEKSDA